MSTVSKSKKRNLTKATTHALSFVKLSFWRDTQIQPITGSCMEARPKGHLARVLKVVREKEVSWKTEPCMK